MSPLSVWTKPGLGKPVALKELNSFIFSPCLTCILSPSGNGSKSVTQRLTYAFVRACTQLILIETGFHIFRVALFCKVLPIYRSLRTQAERAMRDARTMGIEEPWFRESVLTRKLLHDGAINGKSRFHKYDLWHSFHLGAGKHWIGSAMMILQSKIPGREVGERFSTISAAYKQFCRREKMTCIVSKLDQHLFGSTLEEPQGTWSKAALTSNPCLFLEDYLSHHPELIGDDERLRLWEF